VPSTPPHQPFRAASGAASTTAYQPPAAPMSDLRGMQKIPLSALFAAKNSASANKS
jgi:hypothetical protein